LLGIFGLKGPLAADSFESYILKKLNFPKEPKSPTSNLEGSKLRGKQVLGKGPVLSRDLPKSGEIPGEEFQKKLAFELRKKRAAQF